MITSNFFMSAHSKLRVCDRVCAKKKMKPSSHTAPQPHPAFFYNLAFVSIPLDDPSTLTEFQIHTNTSQFILHVY